MALIECPECRSEVSDKADACPNCGYPMVDEKTEENKSNPQAGAQSKRKDKNKNTGCGEGCLYLGGIFVVIIIALAVIGGNSNQNSSSNQASDRPSSSMADVICEDFVEKRLKSPSSAEFASYTEVDVEDRQDGVFLVKSHVDATNSFGAELRKEYSCKVKYAGDDQWKLLSLKIR